MQDGLQCCLSLDLFDLEFLELYFSSVVRCVANKDGTRTAISKKVVLAAKSSCGVALMPVEGCAPLGFPCFLATGLWKQYTGLKKK